MDAAVAALLAYGWFVAHSKTEAESVMNLRRGIPGRAGQNLATKESAAGYGFAHKHNVPASWHATHTSKTLLKYDSYGGDPTAVNVKILTTRENLRADLDRVTGMEVDLQRGHRGRLIGDLKYPTETPRMHALRRVQYRVSALDNPKKYVASLRGKDLIPSG